MLSIKQKYVKIKLFIKFFKFLKINYFLVKIFHIK